MATVIPHVVNWSVTPQNGEEDYFAKMNIWLSESTNVIASLSTAITKINESNAESNDNLEEVLTARDQTVAARNEAVTAVATLTAGAIDDTTIAPNKAFSNQYIENYYYDKTEIENYYYDKTEVDTAINNSSQINTLTDKPTPIDTDNLALQETGGLLKKLSFANLKLWILSLFNPSLTGTVSFNSAINNIQLTNIVTSLGLKIGDVILISGAEDAKNNSEFTVEVIIDDNNIIVNQAHANKGTTKNVATRASNTGVTVKLLAKWYNAHIGLGRGDIVFPLSVKTTRQNLTGRPILVNIYPSEGGGVIALQNITTGTNYITTITTGAICSITALIGVNDIYKWIIVSGAPTSIIVKEVR